MEYSSFLFKKEEGIATITFNRPATLNSLTFQVYEELAKAMVDLREDKDVRCLVITGTGRGFCSGGDVKEIIGELLKRDAKGLLEFTRLTGAVTLGIRNLKKPAIAAINGIAAGAGAVIALACDMRIAVEEARFAFLFVKVGLSGSDMGAAYLLPKVVGMGKASELLFTGDIIDAREAERIGLVNRVVPADQLMSVTYDMARKIADGPPLAISVTKDLLNNELPMSLESAVEAEAEAQALLMLTKDFREGYQAFIEKRAPVFTGK